MTNKDKAIKAHIELHYPHYIGTDNYPIGAIKAEEDLKAIFKDRFVYKRKILFEKRIDLDIKKEREIFYPQRIF